ncbi:MAG: hypothetical protein PHV16_04875, partial [Candidatus Nanoarchaeia archaeon]|nr:hypothetical protein [Candidatus Nanoarchaeia archaeon]
MNIENKIARPYLVISGNPPEGNHQMMDYIGKNYAKQKKLSHDILAKVVSCHEINRIKINELEKISAKEFDKRYEGAIGYVVHRFKDGIQMEDLPLFQDDLFIGESLKSCLIKAIRKKEKYVGKEKDFNPEYGCFKP